MQRQSLVALVVLTCFGWNAGRCNGSELSESIVKPLDIDETSIAAGIEHSCAIYTPSVNDVGGRVLCWGEDGGGQSSPPDDEFIQISTGRLHSCGVRLDESVICWGIGAPKRGPDGLFEQISSGDFHTCGVLKDKTIKCWGDPTGSITRAPEGKFVQVSCGKSFSCALTIDGDVICWGENFRGQCNVPSGLKFLQISASPGDFVCGITTTYDVVCWGDNHRKQCNPPRAEGEEEEEKYVLVSTSRLAACAIKQSDRHVVCWGMKSGVTSVPKDIAFDELTLGWNHGCGIRYDDGGVTCWGERSSGQVEVPSQLR